MCVYVYVYVYVCRCIYVCMCVYVYMRICVYVYGVCVRVRRCVRVCKYAFGALRQHHTEKDEEIKRKKAGGLTESQLKLAGYTATHIEKHQKELLCGVRRRVRGHLRTSL